MTGERYGLVSFIDYSPLRIKLMGYLLERVEPERSNRIGLIGAAAVVLHAAIEEWVVGYLRADANELAIESGDSYNRIMGEMDLRRRSLEWKIDRLCRQARNNRWGLNRATDEVNAILSLNAHRNRLVHMESHDLHLPLMEQGDPPPSDTQMYEVGRLRYEVKTIQKDDGSEESLGERTVVIQDPWRALPLKVIRNAEAAFRELKSQYAGRTGEHVGVLELPDGPIWKLRSED